MDWESTFKQWARPPSETERDKMENAERIIKKAFGASDALRSRNIRVFAQGSYRNRTNISQESDVDICVLCTNTFHFVLPTGCSREQFCIDPATYHDETFRADIDYALKSYFRSGEISVGNKAWNIRANTNRVDADVVACFEYRFYHADRTYRSGTALLQKSGPYIANYPEQNYENGKLKNEVTNRRFRAVVRILKNLSSIMTANRVDFPQLPSFLIESLVWNVPNEGFDQETYTANVRWILAHLCDETRADDTCRDWFEVNGCKILFHPYQNWNRAMANASLNAAWRYIGLE